MGNIEYSQLKKFVKNVKKNFSEDSIEKFFNDIARELTKELYDRLWKRTPVRTGFLRHGWNVGLGMIYHNARFYPKKPKRVDSVRIKFARIIPSKDNTTYTVHIINPVFYAPFVEYGHKQQVGRYVAAIGKRLVKPSVKGRFYLKFSVEDLKKSTPQIIQKKIYEFLKW